MQHRNLRRSHLSISRIIMDLTNKHGDRQRQADDGHRITQQFPCLKSKHQTSPIITSAMNAANSAKWLMPSMALVSPSCRLFITARNVSSSMPA